MSVKQYLIDASTRHQVFLQRYAGGEAKKAVKALNRLRRDIMARLSQEPTEFQRNRLSIVLDDLNKLSDKAFTEMRLDVKYNAGKLAANEAQFSIDLYNKTSQANFVLPSEAALLASVELAPMAAKIGNSPVTINDALNQYAKKKAAQVTQIITDGLTLGDTTPQIAGKISSTMSTLHKRQLETLVRTAANHASSIARQAVYEQNSDLMNGYEWVATLDNKTTLICASRDGIVYSNPTDPMPPAHWGCRSTTIPSIKPEFSLAKGLKGKRPAVGASGAGEVSANSSYGGWLRKQPREFIDEALGVERSRLFRSGKLTIDKFVDPTGRVYTLEQLRSMNPFVFQEI